MLNKMINRFFELVKRRRFLMMAPDQWVIVVSSISIVWLVLSGINSYDDSYVKTATEKVTDNYAAALDKSLNQSLLSIDRMAERWMIRNGTPKAEWSNDARDYVDHQAELTTLAIIDDARQIQWVVPDANLQLISYLNQKMQPELLDTRSDPFEKGVIKTIEYENQIFLLYYSKIFKDRRQSPYIASVFSIDTLVQSSLKLEQNPTFKVSLQSGENIIFSHGSQADLYKEHSFSQFKAINFKDHSWLLGVEPTEYFTHNNLVLLPKLGSAVALVFIFIAGFVLYSRQKYRKQNLKLLEHERLMNLFIQKAPAAIAMFDTQMNYIAASHRWYQDYNLEGRNIVGVNHYDLFPSIRSQHPQWLELHQRCLAGETFKINEEAFIQQDGSTIWLRYELYPWSNQFNEIGGIIMFTENISDQKKIELVKNEFISTVSHELRTPLTSIKGSLVLLKSRLLDSLDQKSNRLLSISVDNCERLSKLVNDILDMQKISAGRMDYSNKTVDVREEVNTIIERNHGLAIRYNIRFLVQAHSGPALFCSIDPHRFEQVISNVLSNAAKFSPQKQSVIVKIYEEENNAVIAITDFGPGIKEEFKKKIFQRFSQADSSDTRINGGTGLGLNISKSIVDAFHGQIYFKSEVDKGTTFYITLPLVNSISADSL